MITEATKNIDFLRFYFEPTEDTQIAERLGLTTEELEFYRQIQWNRIRTGLSEWALKGMFFYTDLLTKSTNRQFQIHPNEPAYRQLGPLMRTSNLDQALDTFTKLILADQPLGFDNPVVLTTRAIAIGFGDEALFVKDFDHGIKAIDIATIGGFSCNQFAMERLASLIDGNNDLKVKLAEQIMDLQLKPIRDQLAKDKPVSSA